MAGMDAKGKECSMALLASLIDIVQFVVGLVGIYVGIIGIRTEKAKTTKRKPR
jgi:hypothetical protein